MILWRIGFRVYTTRNSRALSDMVCDSPKRLMILWRIGLSFFTTRNSRDLSYIFAIPHESRKNWVSFDNLEFRTLSDMFANLQKRFMIHWRIGFDFTTRNSELCVWHVCKFSQEVVILRGRLIDFIYNQGGCYRCCCCGRFVCNYFFTSNCDTGLAWVQDYEIKVNSTTLKSGEESPPLEVAANEEKVEFEIDVSAAGHRPSIYFLSVYRSERFSFPPYYLYFSSLPANEFQIFKSSCNLKAAIVALTGSLR